MPYICIAIIAVSYLSLTGCSTKADKKSDLPIIQICLFASCSVQSHDRAAAQDEVQGNIEATFDENTNQSSTNETSLEAKLK